MLLEMLLQEERSHPIQVLQSGCCSRGVANGMLQGEVLLDEALQGE